MTDSVLPVKTYPRTALEHVIFWFGWVLFALPLYLVIMLAVELDVPLLYILVAAQGAIHGVSLVFFLSSKNPFSRGLLWLLGGTGMLYFLAFGSCVWMLNTQSFNLH